LLVLGRDFDVLSISKLTGRGTPDLAFGSQGTIRMAAIGETSPALPNPAAWSLGPDGNLALVLVASVQTRFFPYIVRVQGANDIVEYHNRILDHYFLTYDGEEARGIDAGVAGPGWARTGGFFKPGGTTPVCRFFGTPGVGPNSHFFTASAEECEAVRKARGWTFEGLGFHTTPPANGACTQGLTPVHRLYNNRAATNDSNHRFVTDTSLIAPMVTNGWVHEGIVFCTQP
jgi:uncharacterized protein DUF5648